MFAIIGMLVVLAAVIGGFLMEHGPIRVLMQPSELVIIGGAAIGTLLVANPLHTLKGVVSGLMLVISGSKFNKQRYLDALKMMYDLFGKIRHDGPAAVENDVEAPMESKFFSNYPNFLKDHETRDFVCDTMRMAIMGGVEPFDVDQMIEADMDVHAHEAGLAGNGAEHHGRFAARPGDCGRRARRGDDHERAGRASGGNREEGRGGAGGNVSRHSALLWIHRPAVRPTWPSSRTSNTSTGMCCG